MWPPQHSVRKVLVLEPDVYFICVNASNSDKDFAWIQDRAAGKVAAANVSAEYAQLALQGPRAEKILRPLTASALAELKSFAFQFADVAGDLGNAGINGRMGKGHFSGHCYGLLPGSEETLIDDWDPAATVDGSQGLLSEGLNQLS